MSGHVTLQRVECRIAVALALAIALFAVFAVKADAAQVVPGQVIVGYSSHASTGARIATARVAGGRVLKTLPGHQQVLRLAPGQTVSQAVNNLQNQPGVRFVEPNYVVRAQGTLDSVNDTFLNDFTLWGILKVKAPDAWKVTDGAGVVVAVTDSGINLSNPELAPQLWTNPGEIANGYDDDGDGFIDDIHGADWVHGDGSPDDEEGHGTHVSGTIAAAANDGNPSVGVAPGAKIMALKFLDGNGNGDVADAISAIDYAIAKHANVINASWGGAPYSQALEDAIIRANNAGLVMVVAAGNESVNNDSSPSYPASYDLPNLISVAATNSHDKLASFSNRGVGSVDVAAPGVNITSDVGNHYESWSGTSMAAPHVSGIAALVKSHAPDVAPIDIKDAIDRGARPVKALRNQVATGGVANAPRALFAIDNPGVNLNTRAMLRPSSFQLRSPGRKVRVSRHGKVRFRWTPVHDATLMGYKVLVDGHRRAFIKARPSGRAHTSRSIRVSPGRHRWSVIAIDESGYYTKATAKHGKRTTAKVSVRRHR